MKSRPLAVVLASLGLASAASIVGCSGEEPPAVAPLTTCSLTRPALADLRLHAEGTALRDALGRVVVLRGVNAGGRSKLPPFAPFDFGGGGYDAALGAYLDRAASWGINTLRVPFTWEAVEPMEGVDDEAFLKRYDALLDAAWERGMFTIIDFHQDIYAAVLCGDGFPAWTLPGPHPAPHHDCPMWGTRYLTDPDVRAAFDAFWAEGSKSRAAYEKLWDRMATRYRDRPGVIGFEPFNEPAPGTADPDVWEATTLTTFYTGMTARIRAIAPSSLVFLDAAGVDSVLVATQIARPQGEGIVFAPHYYQPAALNGSTPDPGTVHSAVQRWANVGTKWKVPVLLGEFGATNSTPGATGYLAAHFDALDALGWVKEVADEDVARREGRPLTHPALELLHPFEAGMRHRLHDLDHLRDPVRVENTVVVDLRDAPGRTLLWIPSGVCSSFPGIHRDLMRTDMVRMRVSAGLVVRHEHLRLQLANDAHERLG